MSALDKIRFFGKSFDLGQVPQYSEIQDRIREAEHKLSQNETYKMSERILIDKELREEKNKLVVLRTVPKEIKSQIIRAAERGYGDTTTYKEKKSRTSTGKQYNEEKYYGTVYETTYKDMPTCVKYRRFMEDVFRKNGDDRSLSFECKHFIINEFPRNNFNLTDKYQLVTSWSKDKPS